MPPTVRWFTPELQLSALSGQVEGERHYTLCSSGAQRPETVFEPLDILPSHVV